MKKNLIFILLFLLCLLVVSPVEARLTLGVLVGTDEASGEITSASIDEVIAAQTELQHVPPLRHGRAWNPQEESVYRDILPSDEPLVKKLDIEVVPDPTGLVETSAQAERLTAYHEQLLSPSVYAEPVEPLAPPETIVKALPKLPETYAPALPMPELASHIPPIPTAKTAPVEPPVVFAISVVEPKKMVPVPVPEEPMVVIPQVVIAPEPVVPPKVDQPEVTAIVEVAVPLEPDFKSESVADMEQQKTIEEVQEFAKVVPAQELPERDLPVIDESEDALRDDEILSLLGEDTVAAVVAQPDIPPELRPRGIPVVRPGLITRSSTAAEDELLVATIPEPRKKTKPAKQPKLLPEPEPEPGIVYVVPFSAVMVPGEVRARIFDQFVDTLNLKGEALGLQFVILKKGLQKVTPEWLAVRKYITGEIYAYVEDSGSNWTELRGKARLTYRGLDQDAPAFGFEYPVKRFFNHDRSTIDIERIKLSDDISATLSSELLKALQN